MNNTDRIAALRRRLDNLIVDRQGTSIAELPDDVVQEIGEQAGFKWSASRECWLLPSEQRDERDTHESLTVKHDETQPTRITRTIELEPRLILKNPQGHNPQFRIANIKVADDFFKPFVRIRRESGNDNEVIDE